MAVMKETGEYVRQKVGTFIYKKIPRRKLVSIDGTDNLK